MNKVTPQEIELLAAVNSLTLSRIDGQRMIGRLHDALAATPDPAETPLAVLCGGAREFLAFAEGKPLSVFAEPAGKEAINCLDTALKTYCRDCRAAGDQSRPLPGRAWERDHDLLG